MKDIAIIGVAGRFPDARNIRELYHNLLKGHCSAQQLSADRKSKTNLEINTDYKVFSYLEHVDVFDHKFFKISKAEAECMDPHQRILLEVTHEMFESAGYNPDDFWGSNTSVYCGDVTLNYYRLAQKYDPTLLTGNLNTVTASRISRFYNLRGTNLMVDTNCSSTLVATHLACKDLITGDSAYSIVCGVRLILTPQPEDNQKDEVGIMAFDGKTRSFAADAEGTGAGEAAACVLLKPLDKALEDGDLIYGVIKASALNQEAMLSGSLTAPSSKAQAEVINQAWEKAGIDPNTVGYIEPHGSGTKLGDPIEIQGIDLAFKGKTTDKHFVAVSALKSNIGHTDTMAGLSGMVKVLLSLQNKQLFPTTNFGEPNPFIDFDNSVTYINTELKQWDRRFDAPLRAGLSSFGLSGTNAHILLEEAPEYIGNASTHPSEILCLSAQTADSLSKYAQRLQAFLSEEKVPLADLARTLNAGRKHFACKTAFHVNSQDEFLQALTNLDSKTFHQQANNQKKAILIFPDHSDGLNELNAQLSVIYPVYQEKLIECRNLAGTQTQGSYAAFESQYALYHLLAANGISSKTMLGIGVGKLVVDVILGKKELVSALSEAAQMEPQEIPDFGKRFQALIDRETETDKVYFIELATSSSFTKNLKSVQTADSSDYFEWFSMDSDESDAFKNLLKNLYLKHFELNWKEINGKRGNKTWLPHYAFEAIRCWLREPSVAEEKPNQPIEASPVKQAETAAKRIIPSDFDSSKVNIPEAWSNTQKQIARFWIEILKLDEISLDDDFFLLGGHSLLATQLINRIEKTWQIRLEFKNIAQFSTIRSLAEGVDDLVASGSGQTHYPILKAEKKAYYPLSKAQYRQWLLQQFDEQSTAYNLPGVMVMRGNVEPEKLEQAFRKLIERHASLRTSFKLVDGTPYQHVADQVTFNLPVSLITSETRNEKVSQFIRPFNLEDAPLFRAELCRFEDNAYLFLFDIHHIISDGVSSDIILRDLVMAYQGAELPELEFQYIDFSEWQNELFANGEMQRQEDFWLNQFRGELPTLDLPSDFQRPTIKTQAGARIHLSLDQERSAFIRQLAQKQGATIYMTLLAFYTTLLHKYSGNEDVITGSPVAGRSREELEHILGMFVNTLAIRNYPKRELGFSDYLNQLKINLSEVFENQDYPFEELVEKLDLNRDLSRNPLFDTMFSYQQFYKQESGGTSGSGEGMSIEGFGFNNPVSKFDMTWEVTEQSGSFHFHIEYATDLFREETVERMMAHFEKLIDAVKANPNERIGELSILTENELERFASWNQTQVQIDYSRTYPLLFAEACKQFGSNTALVFEGKQLTYQETNHLVNQLAASLHQKGVKSGEIVAIQAQAGLEMVLAVQAVLRAGAAFLPLDHELPSGRVNTIIKEAQVSWLLHDPSQNTSAIEVTNKMLIRLEALQNAQDEFHAPIIEADQLAYLIYTSGSTGKPKGVAIPHKALSNLIHWYLDYYQPTATDRIGKYAGFGFDASILELFPAFLVGASLHPVPEEKRKDIHLLHEFMLGQQITQTFLPTAIAELYLEYENPHLKKLLIGASKYNRFVDQTYQIYDNYGPSENTVIATVHGPVTSSSNRHSIGKPIFNNQLAVVDPVNLQLQAIGVKGELLMNGDSLAAGYYRSEQLTEQSFITMNGQRWYRSGDLARWNTDGEIEFFGRIDQQVKISGYRIEPDEITYLLEQLEEVEAASVQAKSMDGDLALVAYVCGKNFDQQKAVEHLQNHLPAYMQPAYWVKLDALPYTLNGKIDHSKLPLPAHSEIEIRLPENEVQEKLLCLFQDVLKREKISTDAHFFHQGGNSLKATQLLGYVYREFGVAVPLKHFFMQPSILGLAQQLKNTSANQKTERHLPKAAKSDRYRLSPAQKRLYFLHQLNPESIAYNIPGALRIQGIPDVPKLEMALKGLIKRHDALRTRFVEEHDETWQLIVEEASIKISSNKISENNIQQAIGEAIQAFELTNAPLLRVHLLEIKPDDNILVFDIHHIICDGISMAVLMEEFFALYQGQDLQAVEWQYIDYSEWLNSDAGQQSLLNQEQYWESHFAGTLPECQLPYDFSRPEQNSHRGGQVQFELNAETLKQIDHLCQQAGATHYAFLLAAWKLLISKHSGAEDLCVGTPVSGRKHSDLERICGMFVNTLVLRSQPKAELTFNQYLEQVQQTVLDALDNQEYPFESLVEKLEVKRELGRNPMFDAFFTYHAPQEKQDGPLDTKLSIQPVSYDPEIAKFDLSLEAYEHHSGISLQLIYNRDLFAEWNVKHLLARLTRLINELVKNPEMLLKAISVVDEQERKLVTETFNKTQRIYPQEKSITALFEKQANTWPENIAVRNGEVSLSYQELNERANQLGAYLRKNYGIEADDRVGIMLHTSEWLIVAIIGVLKAGGAYVPIDPEYPVERQNYLQHDSGCKVLINEEEIKRFEAEMDQYSGENPTQSNAANNLVYVIYTSGSTGNPKGVLIEHRQLLHYISWFNAEFNIQAEDQTMLLSNIAFDGVNTAVFGALLSGGGLHLISRDLLRSPLLLAQYLNEQQISYIKITPPLLNLMVSESESFEILTASEKLRLLVVGGEKINIGDIRKLRQQRPDWKILNHYGPTETTIGCIYYPIDVPGMTIPIGKPIANMQAYILDQYLQPVPIGVTGELYIAGAGVARGYLNRPELTDERFIPSLTDQSQRMYKSGDLARWLPDGNIEFLGRIDHQVKIRGYRIELGEINYHLQTHPEIVKGTVLDFKDQADDVYLVAYYVSRQTGLETSAVKHYLSEHLPAYMVPAWCVEVSEIPINANGKTDRDALLKLAPESSGTTHELVAPSSNTEQSLLEIWKSILVQQHFGVTDNFFELGGHSLKAGLMVSKIKKVFGVGMPLIEIFRHPTIAELAVIIDQSEQSVYSSIVPVGKRDNYPASSTQKRLYVISEINTGSTQYNMPLAFEILGTFDPERFIKTALGMYSRHASMRTRFHFDGDELLQIIDDNPVLPLELVSCKDEELDQKISESIEVFDLINGPVVKIKLFQTDQGRNIVFVDMHHAFSDGQSLKIMSEEFMKMYLGYELPELNLQFSDYAVWQQEVFRKTEYPKQRAFWHQQYPDKVPVLNMPLDFIRPQIQSYEGDSLPFNISPENSERIRRMAIHSESTAYMLLMAVFNTLLAKYCDQDDLVVGTPVGGRPHPDLHQLIGMFVNTLPIRSRPEAQKTFKHFLNELTENTLNCFEHQEFPLEDMIDELDVEKDLSRNPMFSVMFSYQHMDAATEGKTESAKEPELSFRPYGVQTNTSKFDLQLDARDYGSHIQLSFTYCTKLYKAHTIQRLADHFLNLLDQVLDQPEQQLGKYTLMNEQGKQQLLDRIHQCKRNYNTDITLVAAFKKQAEQTPQATALVFEQEQYSYQDLNELSDKLANYLMQRGVQSGDRVIILQERSHWMIISLLATLKTGAAYVPIDPSYPDERIAYIKEDSSAKLVLDQDLLNEFLQASEQVSSSLADVRLSPKDVAYVIYTSGSTGLPKGVLVEHRNVINLILAQNEHFKVATDERILQFSNIAFDASVEQIFLALLNGAALYVVKHDLLMDGERFEKFLDDQEITHIHTVPAVLKTIPIRKYAKLKRVIAGGDYCPVELAAQWQKHHQFINEYGPTETTVTSVQLLVSDGDLNRHSLPIGNPVYNNFIYILDEQMNLVPDGVQGEIYIGGSGVTRGYLNRPELTTERFPTNPFREGERFYRTGDLGRYLENGQIEFLGRNDDQVKIKGFRIELGEIEAALKNHPAIDECLVLVKKDDAGLSFLVAYYTHNQPLESADLKQTLSGSLPAYMLPSHFIPLEVFPLSENGKIKRSALPDPETTHLVKAHFEPPIGEVELLLANSWQKLLGSERISRHDHFFDLGGDSIKAIQLSAMLIKAGFKLDLGVFFRQPILHEAARNLKKKVLDISQDPAKGEVALTPIQKHFFASKMPIAEHYNQAFALEGSVNLDTALIKEILNQLYQHHDTLRLRFKQQGAEWIQYYADITSSPEYFERRFEIEDQAIIEDYFSEIQAGFELQEGNLFRIAFASTPTRIYVLIAAHHLIIDAVSWRILLEDLFEGYQHGLVGQGWKPQPKSHSFKHWSELLNNYSQQAQVLAESNYWRTLVSRSKPNWISALPESDRSSEKLSFELNEDLTEILLRKANKVFACEINDLLLSPLALALKELNGTDECVIEMEGHGREQIHEDLELSRSIGWFTSLYPVLLSAHGADWKSRMNLQRERTKNIPNKGIGFGVLKYLNGMEGLNTEAGILFNYLGQTGGSANANNSTTPLSVVQEDKQLRLSGISKGRSSDNRNTSHPIVFTAVVSAGKLQVQLEREIHATDRATVEQLLQSYQKQLSDLLLSANGMEIQETEDLSGLEALETLLNRPVFVLRNNNSDRNLFLCPPAIGFSMVYQDLANAISDCNVYGLNFIADEQRMERYVQEMITINGNKPYLLGGYSGGANLAYQLASMLEERGYVVSDLIMMDGMRTYAPKPLTENELHEKVEQYVSEEAGHISHQLLKTKAERDYVRKIVSTYQAYLHATGDFKSLQTHIHQLLSEQQWEEGNVRKAKWAELVPAGAYITYQGVGEHGNMLNPEHLDRNAELIQLILNRMNENETSSVSEEESKA